MMLTVVVSHPFAKSANGWGTRQPRGGMIQRLGEPALIKSPQMIAVEQSASASWLQITTGAAIGAVSANIFSFVNGVLERKSRIEEAERERSASRKQMLIQEAAKLAELRLETVKRTSELSGQRVTLL